ncbi:MAG TPA: recombinase family protein [Allosphingosinicella sp.]|nr:recombinase family protein [Allosphingosinicella sp.]
MKSYFAYIRVSTVKQGEHGSSLQEQRAAIEAFAGRAGLTIAQWFEERETAAKQGRTAFNRMLAELERGRAAGLIIHKIDRSARNLRDWARLGELMDRGIEVHFVQDNLDLTTRGGRLSADIQAVVAADYIRNLREEVRKGFYGRLKQGFYPLPAPRGYLDRGKGKPKEIHPVDGPLVRQAFELYSTGNYGLHELRLEMATRGLRSRTNKPLALDSISRLLRNPFYVGLVRIKRTGETFEGAHEPLIAKAVFGRVQDVLDGRLYPRVQIHRFLFRRLIKCETCGRSLTGERQKGRVYYRCHDYGCRGVSISEERLDKLVRDELAWLKVDDGDIGDFRELLAEEIAKEEADGGRRREQVDRDLGLVDQRMDVLTSAVLDGTIDKETYERRKASLIDQRLALRDLKSAPNSTYLQSIAQRFELGLAALEGYEIGNDDEKRNILKSVSSNLVARQNEPVFPMLSPFADIRKWSISTYGAPRRNAVRTAPRDRRRKLIRHFVSTLAEKAAGTQNADSERTTNEEYRKRIADRFGFRWTIRRKLAVTERIERTEDGNGRSA